MFEPKTEMQARLQALKTLSEALQKDPAQALAQLPGEQQAAMGELLAELLDAHAESQRQAWLHERAQAIVDVLFPTYRKTAQEADKPLRWPEKDWWWNGASIDELREQPNGGLEVDLSSYVGRGDTDRLEGFVLPRAWVEADDVQATAAQACVQERARRDEAQRQQALADARAQAQRAAQHLRELEQGGRRG